MNPLAFITLALGLLLFFLGERLLSFCSTSTQKTGILLASFIAALPGILIATYYFHLFDNATWFYQFRETQFSELTAAGSGLFAGVLSGFSRKNKIMFRTFLLSILSIGIFLPHIKPLVAPIPSAEFSVKWSNDVCIQSTPSTCGPACAATILKMYGIHVEEQEIARECYSYRGGTENWYIARSLKKRSVLTKFEVFQTLPQSVPYPSIAGIRLDGGIGHFITILAEENDAYVIGDPLVGVQKYSKDKIDEALAFTGFFMVFKKKADNDTHTDGDDRVGDP